MVTMLRPFSDCITVVSPGVFMIIFHGFKFAPSVAGCRENSPQFPGAVRIFAVFREVPKLPANHAKSGFAPTDRARDIPRERQLASKYRNSPRAEGRSPPSNAIRPSRIDARPRWNGSRPRQIAFRPVQTVLAREQSPLAPSRTRLEIMEPRSGSSNGCSPRRELAHAPAKPPSVAKNDRLTEFNCLSNLPANSLTERQRL